MSEFPPGSSVWSCPLTGCEWTHTQAAPDAASPAGFVVPAATLEESLQRASMAIMTEWYASAERAIEAHLSTHTPLEWVTEVQRLRRLADAVAAWDAFMRTPMTCWPSREEEQRELDAELALQAAFEVYGKSGR